MSKNISLATALEKNKLSSDVAFLALIDVEIVNPANGVVVTTLHIVNNPTAVISNGNTYEPGAFDITLKAESGKSPEVNLSVNDYSQAIQNWMQQYGGGVGSNVTLTVVRSDAPDLIEIAEYFQITGASAAGFMATFQLGAENAIANTFPRRRQTRDFCPWRYKSAECGYVGSLPTCDLTLTGANGCKVHGRALAFGAFPGINSNGRRYA